MPDSPPPTRIEARQERTESARLDNFVDGAFAFAITLLIISGGGLPKNVAALEHALRGIPAFAACFLQLALFWHGHVRWRDSVCLTDGTSRRLSLLLVFFALIFVFPLHLVFSSLFHGLSGGVLSPDFSISTHDVGRGMSALFACFGLSFACMAGTLAVLYRHGVHVGAAASPVEAVTLRVNMAIWALVAAVGLLSTLVAILVPARFGSLIGLPGFVYFLLVFSGLIADRYATHLKRRLPS